jgi:hypothetical protein
MAYSIWGFGTMFYGEADEMADGSHVTTEWLTALWMPVVPLVSLRVKSGGERTTYLGFYLSRSLSYTILYSVPLHWKQIGKTYAKALAIIAGICAGVGVLKLLGF